MIVNSVEAHSGADHVALTRVRRRGAVAAMTALFVIVAVAVAVATGMVGKSPGDLSSFGPFSLLEAIALPLFAAGTALPPAVLSLVLLLLLAVVFHAAFVEYRMPGARLSGTPVLSRLLAGISLILVVPMGLVSIFFETAVNEPDDCVPFVPPGAENGRNNEYFDHCAAMGPGETGALAICVALVIVTVLLLVVAMVLGGRSRTVSWLVFPLAIGGCMIAVDLGHVVAVLVTGTGT